MPFDRLKAICVAAILFFVVVIFLPPVYVLSFAFGSSFNLDETGVSALTNSFLIAFAVTVADLIFGLPLAWVLARRKSMRFSALIDTLVDMPLVVPTSVLGLSVYYFWGSDLGWLLGVDGGLVGKGPLLIWLLHVAFTFPYVVRSIEAAIFQIERTHEQAATMLGASPLTVFRTISLPLFKAGVISGAILAFTRSLSETGATMMVAGVYSTAPTLVVEYKNSQDISSAAAVSIVLIISAVALLLATKIFSGGFKVPIVRVLPSFERRMSRMGGRRDLVVFSAVTLFILLPTFNIVLGGLDTIHPQTFSDMLGDYPLLESIFISFLIGIIVTCVNLVVALPLGLVIARDMFRVGRVVDTLADVILLVPTSALGLSLALFWGGFSIDEFAILCLAHLSFTFPLMVKPISAALSGVNPGLEDAARTLGARQFTTFRKVTYPLIKPGIIAGIIMTFMRSLSETGATLSVSQNIKTVSVLLVDLFKQGQVDDKTILACIILFAASFAFILFLKRTKNAVN